MTRLTREALEAAKAAMEPKPYQPPVVVVPAGYLEAGKRAMPEARVVEARRPSDGYAFRAPTLMPVPMTVDAPADPVARKLYPIICHRCGSLWTLKETEHKDGVYCPRCPDYKDEHNSLEERCTS